MGRCARRVQPRRQKAKIGEGLSLQSLPQMSRGFTHLPRGGEALPTDAIGID
jgi:hypothetical protein